MEPCRYPQGPDRHDHPWRLRGFRRSDGVEDPDGVSCLMKIMVSVFLIFSCLLLLRWRGQTQVAIRLRGSWRTHRGSNIIRVLPDLV